MEITALTPRKIEVKVCRAPCFNDDERERSEPTAILALEVGEGTLRLFNTLTTFGTPQDLSLQELRIEMSFPADGATEALLHEGAIERK